MQQIDPQTRTVPNSCFSSVSLKHQRKSGESDLKIMPYCSVLYIPHLFETWVWKLLPHCEDTWCRALSVCHQLSMLVGRCSVLVYLAGTGYWVGIQSVYLHQYTQWLFSICGFVLCSAEVQHIHDLSWAYVTLLFQYHAAILARKSVVRSHWHWLLAVRSWWMIGGVWVRKYRRPYHTSRGRDRNLLGVWQIDRGISPIVRSLPSPCVGIPLPARNHFCSFHNALPRSGQR